MILADPISVSCQKIVHSCKIPCMPVLALDVDMCVGEGDSLGQL